MTQRWQIGGWVCVGLAVVLAVVALVLAFQSQQSLLPVGGVRIDIAPLPVVTQPSGLLGSVVLGVLAGVAFFTGLAFFFWSAVVEARRQRAEIIALLGGRGGTEQVGNDTAAPPPVR